MSKHPTTIDDFPEKSVLATYWRLLTAFALRYWFRLSLGILAGMLVGGTLAAGLRVMDIGVNMFESGLINQPPESAIELPAIPDSTQPEPPAPEAPGKEQQPKRPGDRAHGAGRQDEPEPEEASRKQAQKSHTPGGG